jgi:hypothetical protein
MAAFTAEDPDDRTAFDVHMAKVRTSPEVTNRAITVDGRLVGSIASFVIEGDTEVTYWIDRSFWGQGIAGRAITGTEISFANGRNAEIEERILRLDEPANTAPSDVSSGLRSTYWSRQIRMLRTPLRGMSVR